MSTRTRARAHATSRARFELIPGDTAGRRTEFGAAIRTGLTASAKHIPTRWLFDTEGIALLEQVRVQPEYYQLRAERQLLADRAYAAPLYFPTAAPLLVEVGSPNAERTTHLVAPFLETHSELRYIAVGHDRAAVEPACRELSEQHPGLRATATVGRLVDALRKLRASTRPVLLYWPEAGLANHDRGDVAGVLAQIADALRPSDLFISGLDLRKDPRLVQRAYRDRAGRARRLQLNVLERINEELGGHFDISNFRDRVTYDEVTGQVDTCLVSRRSQTVRIAALDIEVRLTKGETIHTITATKFSPREIDRLAETVGLVVHERWYDRNGQVSANLMRLRPRGPGAPEGQPLLN